MGLKSEKEIKERINVLEHTICPSPQQEEELKVLEELLEGEPRYSWGEWVERIRENPISERSSELLDNYLICTKEEIQTIQKVVDFHGTPVIKDLGTEPRYSVKELRVVWTSIINNGFAHYVNPIDCILSGNQLFDFLEDSKKVEEILNGP